MLSMYPACFYKEKEGGGGYSVIFPILDIATCGETFDEAMSMAVDLLAGFLHDLKLEEKEFPKAPEMEKINPDSIYNEYESVSVNMVTVDVDEYAKEYFDESVKKILKIPAWLNDKAIENNIDFSAVLREALENRLNINNINEHF